jgi:integrase
MSKGRRSRGSGTLYKRGDNPVWIAAWYTHDGRRLDRSTRTTDRRAAERVLAKRVSDALLRKEGVVDARMDSFTAAERRPIEAHIMDFARALRSRAVTPKYVRMAELHVRRIVVAAGIERLGGLTISAAQIGLAAIRSGKATGKPTSLRTCAAHHRSIKTFTRWLARDGRIPADPLLYLSGYSTDTDRRLERRALDADEFERLVIAAEAGPEVLGMSGADRAISYMLAAGTGFRVSEIRSLTGESFDLDEEAPAISVKASISKRRKRDVQPIRLDLARRLRSWLQTKPAEGPVLPLPHRTADMIRADLKAARAVWLEEASTDAERKKREKSFFLSPHDAAGRSVDYHALRHTFITRVVRSGASVKVAQTLARHSTPLLTLNHYTHLRLADLTQALDGLPATAPARSGDDAELRPTGTHGADIDHQRYHQRKAHDVARTGATRRNEAAPKSPR